MLRILFSGDSILLRDFSVTPKGFDQIVSVIRGCDVAFTNLELTIPSESSYLGKFWNQGTPIAALPRSIDLLKEIGIDGVSFANNHTFDWGTNGLINTIETLKDKKMPFSGAGYDKADAQQALVLNVKGKQVGLLGITSRYPEWGGALNSIDGYLGKPGVNTLEIRERPFFSVEFSFFGKNLNYTTGGSFFPNGYFVNDVELLRLSEIIKEKSSELDKLFISFHYHERPEKKRISKVLHYVCRSFIDNGASGVFVHGGHRIKGFEVYNYKPIFYGVGNLFYQVHWVERLHPEFMPKNAIEKGIEYHDYIQNRLIWNDKDVFEAIMPVCEFSENSKLKYIDLYPIDLGFKDQKDTKGIPRLGCVDTLDSKALFIGNKDLKEKSVKQGFIRYKFS